MGADAHEATEVEQMETDMVAVFGDSVPNLELIARVEVPQYSQPTGDGERLSRDKRLSLAVARAVEKEWSMIPFVEGPGHNHSAPEGTEFMVMDDVNEPMESVTYEQNPAFDAVWDPESRGDA